MNTKIDRVIDADTDKQTGREDRTHSVQSSSTAGCLPLRLGRLGAWIAARIRDHEYRVISLRVYSQQRLDGRVDGRRKDG